jgi:hypothetical protein
VLIASLCTRTLARARELQAQAFCFVASGARKLEPVHVAVHRVPHTFARRRVLVDDGYVAAEFIAAFGDFCLVHRDEVVGRLQRHACKCCHRVRLWWNGAAWCR